MSKKIKLRLNKLQWELLGELLSRVTQQTPVKYWELESYVISGLYINKMQFFQIYPYTKKGVKLSLTMAQAIAVNRYCGVHSEAYNKLLRIYIEPFLIMG